MTPTPEPTPAPRKDAKFLMSQISSPHMSDLKVIENFLAARDAEKDALIAELRMQRDENARSRSYCRDQEESQKVRAEQAEAATSAVTRKHELDRRELQSQRARLREVDAALAAMTKERDDYKEIAAHHKEAAVEFEAEIDSLREPVGSEEVLKSLECIAESVCNGYRHRDGKVCWRHRQTIVTAFYAKSAALKQAESEILSHHEEEEQRCGYKKLIDAQAKLAEAEAKIAALETCKPIVEWKGQPDCVCGHAASFHWVEAWDARTKNAKPFCHNCGFNECKAYRAELKKK